VKLSLIAESDVDYAYIDDEQDWEVANSAVAIANDSGIRISRNKSLLAIAYGSPDGYKFGMHETYIIGIGKVCILGAVWHAVVDDGEGHHYYDFDVAVSPRARSMGLTSNRIGPKLIELALKEYKRLQSDGHVDYIRVWVVNNKLADYLERVHDFEPSGTWTPRNPLMTKY
jgi:hypothetical protein